MNWLLGILVVPIILLTIFINYIRKSSFSIGNSILWASIFLLSFILLLYPAIIDKLSKLLGIYYPPSALFLCSILFLFIITLKQEKTITKIERKIKKISQYTALNENKLRNSEKN